MQPSEKCNYILIYWFILLWMRSHNSTWQILAICVSLLDLEPGPILRHCARSSLCVLRLPLPGGCGRLAALRPAVGAQTHLRVWHSHSLARRHRQPTRGRVAGCVLCSLVPPYIDASFAITKPLLCDPTGAMYPTSMRINEEGRLVVNFKTEARFRGQFVMSHPGMLLTIVVHFSEHSHPHTHSLPEAAQCGHSTQPPASY